MRDGFIRIAAGSPDMQVANARYNTTEILKMIDRAAEGGAQLLVLPELAITGYTAGDLLMQGVLQAGALEGLKAIREASEKADMVIVFGLPVADGNCLYDCAAVIKGGRILGIVPKMQPANYNEMYELRQFAPGFGPACTLRILGEDVPFGADLIFACEEAPAFRLAVEIGTDLWAPNAPSVRHALAGATVIACPAASGEIVGKAEYRRMLVASHSARLVAAYALADAGVGESTQDGVFAGRSLIAEKGRIGAEGRAYENDLIFSDVDLAFLEGERRKMNTFREEVSAHTVIPFSMELKDLDLNIRLEQLPFVPSDPAARASRCEEIIGIQAHALARRIKHTWSRSLVLGVSGGLDSTLAMLVAARALKIAGLPSESLLAVTMPCFGTTNRTYNNALKLAESLGAQLKEVNIKDAVRQHFKDIELPETARDVTYENSQARERTQVLMDLANKTNGLVVGTGDLSEMALGWATYNGDHMSMYGVNCSIPKTLMRYLVGYVADTTDIPLLREVLLDVLDTPVSPELLPPSDGKIAQKTEDLVGPYELHDFYLYHFVRRGASPQKILRLAKIAFAGKYEDAVIEKWLSTFMRRFFIQQFKRSCVPDGPKVGTVALSPRGDWRMPTDASSELWKL